MWNEPTKEKLNRIPKLYETKNIPLKHTWIYLWFFIGSSSWYVCEYDKDSGTFFGFVIINGDYQNAKWGYFNYQELKDIKIYDNGFQIEIENETNWEVRPAIEVEEIAEAQGWTTTIKKRNVWKTIN